MAAGKFAGEEKSVHSLFLPVFSPNPQNFLIAPCPFMSSTKCSAKIFFKFRPSLVFNSSSPMKYTSPSFSTHDRNSHMFYLHHIFISPKRVVHHMEVQGDSILVLFLVMLHRENFLKFPEIEH